MKLKYPSLIFLVLSNLFPLFGVFFLEWDLSSILLLFWLENIIIGFFNVFKLIIIKSDNDALKAFSVPFFIMHYGLFTFVHGIFLYFLLFSGFFSRGVSPMPSLSEISLGVIFLCISHCASFFMNFVGNKEYLKTGLQAQMGAPYGRVLVMHFAIIFGAFLFQLMDRPLAMLLVMIVAKIALDAKAHLDEREKYHSPA